MTRDFGIPAPRLAFSGLNPHAGEDGTIGDEELKIINPAAHALRLAGIDISDARPGDTVFAEALSGAYDAVIAMTHDAAGTARPDSLIAALRLAAAMATARSQSA